MWEVDGYMGDGCGLDGGYCGWMWCGGIGVAVGFPGWEPGLFPPHPLGVVVEKYLLVEKLRLTFGCS